MRVLLAVLLLVAAAYTAVLVVSLRRVDGVNPLPAPSGRFLNEHPAGVIGSSQDPKPMLSK